MEEYLMNDGVFLFQLICAGLCGMAVGIERQSRMKSAGVRTHFVVAMASALMMIVSKYGFLDVISINGARVDVSRVAAGIISGIGILGGGLIFIGKQGLVSGMTTAAGIWMTVGIGMAMGLECMCWALRARYLYFSCNIYSIESLQYSKSL